MLKHVFIFFVFWLILRPLIKRNYKLRAQGKLKDEWYWADLIAVRNGYFVDFPMVKK